jgi:hypothetical protein
MSIPVKNDWLAVWDDVGTSLQKGNGDHQLMAAYSWRGAA